MKYSKRTRRNPSSRLDCESLEDRRMLATFTVFDAADSGPSTLRDAVAQANANPGPDDVVFASGLSPTINLTSGQIDITDDLTITGFDNTINAGGTSRIFAINDGTSSLIDVTLTDLRFVGGQPSGVRSSGAIAATENLTIVRSEFKANVATSAGGAIRHHTGSLTITDSALLLNQTHRYSGGAIAFTGDNLTIVGSTISGNEVGTMFTLSSQFGGGIYFAGSGNLLIEDSTISGNTSGSHGGGIFAKLLASVNQVNIRNSTISANHTKQSSANGGGLFLTGTNYSQRGAYIDDTTISGNSANDDGGAIFLDNADAFIEKSTISGNSAGDDGGGIFLVNSSFAGVQFSTITNNLADADNNGNGVGGGIKQSGYSPVNVGNSIVANNADQGAAPDIDTAVSSLMSVGHSLIGDNTGSGRAESQSPDASGNLIGSSTGAGVIDPMLGPLSNNGGFTSTHALLVGSAAIERGDPDRVPGVNAPLLDQRGAPRAFGSRIDMGAFELIPPTLTVDTLTDEDDGNSAPGDLSLREAVLAANFTSDANTIQFAPSLVGGTILLTNGELIISQPLRVSGLGATMLTIDANDSSRIFNISDGTSAFIDVTLEDLRLTGGKPSGVISGGAISASENLTIHRSIISGNTASSAGGAIRQFSGSLAIFDSQLNSNETYRYSGGAIAFTGTNLLFLGSTISGNVVGTMFSLNSQYGGGIHFGGSGSLHIESSVISGNVSGNDGGGVFAQGGTGVNIVYSTVAGNHASKFGADGGGVFISGVASVLIQNSTISDNMADDDGGGVHLNDVSSGAIFASTVSGNSADDDAGGIQLFDSTNVAVLHSTITDNNANGSGGGLGQFGNSSVVLDHTIVAGNSDAGSAPDVQGTLTTVSATFSLVGNNTGSGLTEAQTPDASGNLIGSSTGFGVIDAMLEPLGDYGGTTQTHVLMPGSPAINAGNPAFNGPPTVDQRAVAPFARELNGRVDMGSVETAPTIMQIGQSLDELDIDVSPTDLSFREAIELANGNPDVNLITFDAAVTSLPLTLGELAIRASVSVRNIGTGLVTIDAQGNSRVFNIDDGKSGSPANYLDVELTGLTITGGATQGDAEPGGGIRSAEHLALINSVVTLNSTSGNSSHGGGLYMVGNSAVSGGANLYVSDSKIAYNSTDGASSGGGGIAFDSDGMMTITDSFIRQNTSGEDGGGLFVIGSSSVEISKSTIASNASSGDGGGVHARNASLSFTRSVIADNQTTASNGKGAGIFTDGGLTTISQSVVSGNSASNDGGGVYVLGGDLSITNSTVSGNDTRDDGGGIFAAADATVSILYSTVTDNRADDDNSGGGSGGGVQAGILTQVTLDNSIVAGNFVGRNSPMVDDLAGPPSFVAKFSLIGADGNADIVDAGGSLIGTVAAPIDPLLAPLAANGGQTLTHALLAGSPAIHAGDPTPVGPPDFDQRGAPFVRVAGGRIDMGAFELESTAPDGDFNDDGLYDAVDIDALVANIALGPPDPVLFDLTGDGNVNLADRDAWLAEAGAVNLGPGKVYLLGDATLDGFVNGQDFLAWNDNKFTSTAAWSAGDFTADGFVNGQDFLVWNDNKFTSSDVNLPTLLVSRIARTRAGAILQTNEKDDTPAANDDSDSIDAILAMTLALDATWARPNHGTEVRSPTFAHGQKNETDAAFAADDGFESIDALLATTHSLGLRAQQQSTNQGNDPREERHGSRADR